MLENRQLTFSHCKSSLKSPETVLIINIAHFRHAGKAVCWEHFGFDLPRCTEILTMMLSWIHEAWRLAVIVYHV